MSADQREAWRAELPELPGVKRHRYAEGLGLSQYDARVLTDERPMADYFEAAVASGVDAKLTANWITGDIAAYVNSKRLSYGDLPLRPEQLSELVKLIEGGTISGKPGVRNCRNCQRSNGTAMRKGWVCRRTTPVC